MSKTDYISEDLRQLNGRKSYLKLDYDMTPSTIEMVSDVIDDMFSSKEIDKALYEYLDPTESCQTKTPVFFMLPKVHKTPKEGAFVGRPVTSHCGGPLNRISEFIDHFLLPEVQKSSTYLKDTADTIRKIEGLSLPDNTILASIDIVSMFTSIPQDEAYDVAMATLEKLNPFSYDPPMPSLKSMGKLLKLVLYRNAFEFNGQFFLQISGTPMGLRSSVSLSCLVANTLVKQILELDDHILSFHVYMDDTLLLWSGSMAQLDSFITKINDLHPTLKFTHEASNHEIQFLDLTIYKGERFKSENILDIKNFTKPTETWGYLQRNSCHYPPVFKGFIKGELIRLVRNSSDQDTYEQRKKIFTDSLLNRGYTSNEIEAASKEVSFEDRHTFISEKTTKGKDIPLVFKIRYFPQITNSHIKNAILKHWEIIRKRPALLKIFPKMPIFAFSRAENLSDILVRAKLVPGVHNNPADLSEHEDDPQGSQTLQMLNDLALESRGFQDFFIDPFIEEPVTESPDPSP